LEYLPFVPNPNYFGFPNPFASTATSDYQLELDAEVIRCQFFQFAPSRLSAVYAFGDYDSCVQVHERYRWPLEQVQRFRLQPHEHARVWRVNMEIVSLARASYLGNGFVPLEDAIALWRSYWSGTESVALELTRDLRTRQRVTGGRIWEYLLEGILEAVDSHTPPTGTN
jgi:hypothetical protein